MAVSIKLQKYLADCGIGSRREIERFIKECLITVNDKLAHQGQRIFGDEVIHYCGKLVEAPLTKPPLEVLLYHKPLNQICTRFDPQARPTVFTALPVCHQGRWIMVGRLDNNTTGLLLFTNNGELANRLMHPKYGVERTYCVVLNKAISKKQVQALLNGIILSDGLAQCKRVQFLSASYDKNKVLKVVLTEGRNREVRRLFAALGFKVVQLTRLQYGGIRLSPSQKIATVQRATYQQVAFLQQQVNLSY